MTRRFVAVGNDLGPGFGSYTIVDVETSGLDSTKHRVLSVAAVRLGVDGQVCDEYHTLVDPGCDPGPIHIHGLTREKLRGAPCFENIRHHLSKHLTGQVLVAHNAQHDYRFLAREFSLVGSTLPVPRRLCTLAFAHRVAVPTPDHKLRTLAAYYNVEQTRWHDALDDARVLAKILRALTADAARLGIPTPLLTCSPDDVVAGTTTPSGFNAMRYGPKQPCEYVCPGQFTGQLIQGMKFAITGDTTLERIELVRRAEMGGLDGTGCVSRQTSVIVANQPDRDCTKLRHAREFGTPLITEAQFLSLLQSIQGGIRKCDAAKASRAKPASRQRKSQPITTGPLSGRRMLVVGGTHDEAVLARLRIGELGGSTSVNMSATVTDVLVLPGGESDRRVTKAQALKLGVHGRELLDTIPRLLQPKSAGKPVDHPCDPVTLQRGQVVDLFDLEDAQLWTLRATWAQQNQYEVDIVAFLVDSDGMVGDDADFVFYNQIEGAGVRLNADGPSEQSIVIDLVELPTYCTRIVIAASIAGDYHTFGQVGAIELTASPSLEGSVRARSTLDAATKERTLLLTEIYQRRDIWRIRAIGQGYTTGLDALARRYGVQVDDD